MSEAFYFRIAQTKKYKFFCGQKWGKKKSGSMHLGRLGAVTSLILRHLSEVDMLKVNCIGLHLTVHLKWIVLSFSGGKKSSWNTQRLVYVSFSSELKNEIDFSKKNNTNRTCIIQHHHVRCYCARSETDELLVCSVLQLRCYLILQMLDWVGWN